MSLTHGDRVTCRCGATVEVFVADSLNAVRHPHLRELLLERKLHVFTCGACGEAIEVEKQYLYFDIERAHFIGVFPRAERARAAECGEAIVAAFRRTIAEGAPAFIRETAREYLVRIVFGNEELREKLVIDDAGLSDLVVEELKCRLLAGGPWFQRSGVAWLRVDSVSPDGTLYLLPAWLGGAPESVAPRAVSVEPAAYKAVFAERESILVNRPALAAGPHVSMLRLVDWPAPETPRRRVLL